MCKDIISQVGAIGEERDGEGPETFVHCNGGCGRKVHAECARRLSLAGGSAADGTAARRGRGAHAATEPAALPPPTPPFGRRRYLSLGIYWNWTLVWGPRSDII